MLESVLLFGYGNPSRGDDALGPLLLECVERENKLLGIGLLSDFQLQVEHALDLKGRERVLFVDAAVNQPDAIVFKCLSPERDRSYSSHAMSPAAVLQVYRDITGEAPPPTFLLSIAGTRFELGEPLSDAAKSNLDEACRFCLHLLQPSVTLEDWNRLARQTVVNHPSVRSSAVFAQLGNFLR